MNDRLVWAGIFCGTYGLAAALDALIYKAQNPETTMVKALKHTHKGNINLTREIFREGYQNIKEDIGWIRRLYRKAFGREVYVVNSLI